MSLVNSGEEDLKRKPTVVAESYQRAAIRDRDLAEARLAAHQAYLAGLNPDSIKAEDARRQIKNLEEDVWIKTKWAEEA